MEYSYIDVQNLKQKAKNRHELLLILYCFYLLFILCGCTNQIYALNKKINSYKYIPSQEAHLKTPSEFYKDGGGICNDFANAKRQALLDSGYKDSQIKFVIIPPGQVAKQAHTVLQVDGLILDSMNNNLTPAALVSGFRVNYSQMTIIAGRG